MINDVRLTFAALREASGPGPNGLRVRGIDGGPSNVRLGLDDDGRPHLLVEADPSDAVEPSIAALSTRDRQLQIGDEVRHHLDIVCEVVELSEVFDHFVAAVLERFLESPGDATQVVREVLDRWRSFFAAMGPPPARDTVTAVVGELLLLRDVTRVSPAEALAVWVGPRGGRHDLRRGAVAVEVKTTRSHTSRAVTIHGEDQLLPPDGGRLYLHLVRLEEVAGLGVCINDLVDDLVELGVPIVGLFDALADAGIPPAALSTVAGIRFDVRERLTFAADDHMPRIIPQSFVGGERPQGVLDVTYRIDLDHIRSRALDGSAFEQVVADLATDRGAS